MPKAREGAVAGEVALEFGVDRTYVSGIERGVRNSTILVVERLAKALEVPVTVLFADLDG